MTIGIIMLVALALIWAVALWSDPEWDRQEGTWEEAATGDLKMPTSTQIASGHKAVLDDLVAIDHIGVLDNGYVELVDFMGDDNAVVDAARVSFGKRSSQFTEEQNDKLLRYLREHNHGSPEEMVVYKFRVKAPTVVFWQWVRHRMASYNLQSGRYTPFDETEVYRVNDNKWRRQSKSNKQGSEGFMPPERGALFGDAVDRLYGQAFQLYNDMLDEGVAKEQARLVLPGWASYYTGIVQMNARSLRNFLRLRLGKDAQSEIVQYAEAIYDIVRKVHPKTWEGMKP